MMGKKVLYFGMVILSSGMSFLYAQALNYPSSQSIGTHSGGSIQKKISQIQNTSCDTLLGATGGVVVGFDTNMKPICEKFSDLVTPPSPFLDLQIYNSSGDRIDNDSTKFVRSGETFDIRWNPKYVKSCNVDWDISSLGSNANNLLLIPNSISLGAPSISQATGFSYTMSCIGINNASTGNKTVTIQISPGIPKLNFVASAQEILSDATVTLSWSGTNIKTCQATDGQGTDWSGSKNLSGTYTSKKLSQNTFFRLDCTGYDASMSVSSSISISVIDPITPTILFGVNGITTVTLNTPVTLIWTTYDADTCYASEGWSGTKPANGSGVIFPQKKTIYTLTCSKSIIINGETITKTSTQSTSIDIVVNFSVDVSPLNLLSGATIILPDAAKMTTSVNLEGMTHCSTNMDEVTGLPGNNYIFYQSSSGGYVSKNSFPTFQRIIPWIYNSKGSAYYAYADAPNTNIYIFSCTDVNGIEYQQSFITRVFKEPIINVMIRYEDINMPEYTNATFFDENNRPSDIILHQQNYYNLVNAPGEEMKIVHTKEKNKKLTVGYKIMNWSSQSDSYSSVLSCNASAYTTNLPTSFFESYIPTYETLGTIIGLPIQCFHRTEDAIFTKEVYNQNGLNVSLMRPIVCGDQMIDNTEVCDEGINNSDIVPGRCQTSCQGYLPALACGAAENATGGYPQSYFRDNTNDIDSDLYSEMLCQGSAIPIDYLHASGSELNFDYQNNTKSRVVYSQSTWKCTYDNIKTESCNTHFFSYISGTSPISSPSPPPPAPSPPPAPKKTIFHIVNSIGVSPTNQLTATEILMPKIFNKNSIFN